MRCLLMIISGVVLLSAMGCRNAQQAPDLAPITQGVDYFGTWAINDTDNQLFNIIVRPDRTVISNWSRGHHGAWGERGTWKRNGSRLVIEYGDGWTDLLMPSRYGVSRQSYRPGAMLNGTPASFGSAVRVDEKSARYCGVFEVSDEEDRVFVSVLSSGMAYRSLSVSSSTSTSAAPVVGCWSMEDDEIILAWSDGGRQRMAWQRGVYMVQPVEEAEEASAASWSSTARMLSPVDGLTFGGLVQ